MATEMNKTYNPSEIEDRLYKNGWIRSISMQK